MVTEMLNNASASLCQCAFVHIIYAGREREKERRCKVFAPLTFFFPPLKIGPPPASYTDTQKESPQ